MAVAINTDTRINPVVLLRLLLGVMKGGLHLMTWAKSEKAAAHPTVPTAPSSP